MSIKKWILFFIADVFDILMSVPGLLITFLLAFIAGAFLPFWAGIAALAVIMGFRPALPVKIRR